jgi:hypothetical protein
MARRRKSIDDINAQVQRIRSMQNPSARYDRRVASAEQIASAYKTNIRNSMMRGRASGFDYKNRNTGWERGFDRAYGTSQKYSQSTYMGLSNG